MQLLEPFVILDCLLQSVENRQLPVAGKNKFVQKQLKMMAYLVAIFLAPVILHNTLPDKSHISCSGFPLVGRLGGSPSHHPKF